MKGRQYLDDKDEVTRSSKKKVTKKPNSKKSDHKHSYTIKKVVKDRWANLEWELVYLVCDVCGKEKQETRHI